MASRGSGVLHDLRRLAGGTFSICMRHRVTGLAAEIGFFALLSLPPLVLSLLGALGYFDDIVGPDTVREVQDKIVDYSSRALSDQSVSEVIIPTLDDVVTGGRIDIVSLGFFLALWSGSRALNVIIDTITIMYGLGGKRGIIATRALSFSLYLVALVVGTILVPLVLAGPTLAGRTLPASVEWLNALYWPIVVILTVASLTTLFWISVPVPNSWWRGVPGAILALLGWIGGSYGVRVVLDWSVGGTSIYGPLAASIIILIWLYALAITLLIGAAFNAAVDRRWPQRLDRLSLDGSAVETDRPAAKLPPAEVPVPEAPVAEAPVVEVPTARGNSEDTAVVVPLPFPEPEVRAEEEPGARTPTEQEVKRHGRR
jgi:membrane protein